jgi:predicted lipoprotein with Yx(FWY)xxD motif
MTTTRRRGPVPRRPPRARRRPPPRRPPPLPPPPRPAPPRPAPRRAGTGGASASATTAAGASGSATTAAEADEDEESSGTLALADTSAGKVIADGEGRTLYLFTPDAQGAPTCSGSCADTWPYADKAAGAAGVAAGLDASKLGTVKSTEGDEQVTYNGWPLYRFSGDQKAGDVNGIGIGGKWFAVDATGNQVAAK